MDLTPYVQQLREDLATAASAGDEQTRRTAGVLGAALEPAARLALMSALAELAAEVTAALDDRVVDVRLDGRDVRVAVSPPSPAVPAPPPDAPPPPGPPPGPPFEGDVSRMTLRLLDQIKGQAERAAAQQGVSLNTFVQQAVQGALRGERWDPDGPSRGSRRGGGDRLHGWVQG